MKTPALDAQPQTLTVSGLKVQIDTDEGVVDAIDDANLTLRRGEVIGLVGESGSGKSLLSRSIMGLTAPRVRVSGSVTLDGKETVGVSARERRALLGTTFAMVFQDPMTALSPVKTIGDQLTTPIRHNLGVGRGQARKVALEHVRSVGIPDPQRRLGQYPQELSGGMRQRVVIALAMSGRPAFLFADEPTTALDVTVQAQILDLLDEQRAESSTGIILTSHDLGVVAGRTHVVIVMYAGQIVEVAPTRELFARPHMPYTEALLASLPRVDRPPHTRLQAIPGRPPSPASRPTGCRFSPRCAYATDVCRESAPPLTEAEPGHLYRCWFPRNISSAAAAGIARPAAAEEAPAGTPEEEES